MRNRQIQALLSDCPEKQTLTFSGQCQDCGKDVEVVITRDTSTKQGFYIGGGMLHQPFYADGAIFFKCDQCGIEKPNFEQYKECRLRQAFHNGCRRLGIALTKDYAEIQNFNINERSLIPAILPTTAKERNVVNISEQYNRIMSNFLSLSRLKDLQALKPQKIFDEAATGIDPAFFGERDVKYDKHAKYINSGICYEWYFAVAKYFQPVSILEIGVRRGYSLLSMIKGAADNVKFVRGWDIESVEPGSNAIAIKNIKERIDTAKIDFAIDNVNSRRFDKIPVFFDLIHIDGDQSLEGIEHDLNISLGMCNVVIIDDYDYIPNVRKATDAFIAIHKPIIQALTYIPSFRGMLVIEWLESA